MTAVHEIGLSMSWLYSTLSSDSTLAGLAGGGIWRAMAPPTVTTYPLIVFSFQAGTDLTTINGYRIWSNHLFQIRAVGPASSTAAIVNAASRVDVLLGRASGTPTGGIIYSCIRESPLAFDELVNGVLFSNIGNLCRLLVQQA